MSPTTKTNAPNGDHGGAPDLAGDSAWFECIPNVSDGRDPDLIEELNNCARSAGVYTANRTSDRDHNRSVLTWFGTGDSLWQACGACLTLLSERRDLQQQKGVHPRTGLLDVVPFVPLDSFAIDPCPLPKHSISTMPESVDTVRRGASRFAIDHEIPIYLYEEAAAAPERRNLAAHRRALLAPLSPDPTASQCDRVWFPDFGPGRADPRRGVVLAGARRPLVAFNIDLDSHDLRLARRIAARIRAAAPGGLPGVKALGLILPERGCAQVSVNLVDARQTSLPVLVERVTAEAKALATNLRGSELIGLTTRAAVDGASAADLLLPALTDRDFVETHLGSIVS